MPTQPTQSNDKRRGGPGQGGQQGGNRGQGGRGGARGGRRPEQPREFDQKILELSRVTRVTSGGKRMRFRVCLVIGDRHGKVGFGVSKGADVQISVDKALRQAKKRMVKVNLVNETFPYAVHAKFGASSVLLMPAPKGTGLKCGGAVRSVLELAGVPNAVSKSLASSNKINTVKATFEALEQFGNATSTLTRKPKVKESAEAAAK